MGDSSVYWQDQATWYQPQHPHAHSEHNQALPMHPQPQPPPPPPQPLPPQHQQQPQQQPYQAASYPPPPQQQPPPAQPNGHELNHQAPLQAAAHPQQAYAPVREERPSPMSQQPMHQPMMSGGMPNGNQNMQCAMDQHYNPHMSNHHHSPMPMAAPPMQPHQPHQPHQPGQPPQQQLAPPPPTAAAAATIPQQQLPHHHHHHHQQQPQQPQQQPQQQQIPPPQQHHSHSVGHNHNQMEPVYQPHPPPTYQQHRPPPPEQAPMYSQQNQHYHPNMNAHHHNPVPMAPVPMPHNHLHPPTQQQIPPQQPPQHLTHTHNSGQGHMEPMYQAHPAPNYHNNHQHSQHPHSSPVYSQPNIQYQSNKMAPQGQMPQTHGSPTSWSNGYYQSSQSPYPNAANSYPVNYNGSNHNPTQPAGPVHIPTPPNMQASHGQHHNHLSYTPPYQPHHQAQQSPHWASQNQTLNMERTIPVEKKPVKPRASKKQTNPDAPPVRRKRNARMNAEQKKSGYSEFFKIKQKEFKDIGFGDVSHAIANQWHSLSEEERSSYAKGVSAGRKEILKNKATIQAQRLVEHPLQ